MADRPILFSAPMVRALLAGTKTQTRRVYDGPIEYTELLASETIEDMELRGYSSFDDANDNCFMAKPRINWRDRLWVKENGWQRPDRTPQMMRDGADTWEPYYFDADLDEQDHRDLKAWGFKRRPSIHMSRVHSRLTLQVTDVRVQRLQEISEEDAREEGVGYRCSKCGYSIQDAGEHMDHHLCEQRGGAPIPTGIEQFRELWNSINGAGSWEANPWVCAISFRCIPENIDDIPSTEAKNG